MVCFWCVWHSSRSVKNACFSQFFGFLWGGLFLLILGLEGLGVFVFLVFVFVFCVAFVSVLFALFLFCCWIGFRVGSCFAFVFVIFFSFFCFLFLLFFVFLCFVSFGGFKGQVRWPKGPPHLALNPSYFLFLFFLVFFVFLEGLRVR